MKAYYNENDKFAAAWLRELIKEGAIAPGFVDERSIVDVRPEDLEGYAQCHFFAGIGVWSYALKCAGWLDEREVWTGSCPCQSFSCAGKGKGFKDERHLWPEWFRLIAKCRPKTILGEQVPAAIRYGWWDLVADNLEGEDYSCGAVVFPALSVGAWHKRERLYFAATRRDLADSAELRRDGRRRAASVALQGQRAERSGERARPGDDGELPGRLEGLCGVGELGESESLGRIGRQDNRDRGRRECSPGQAGEIGELDNAQRHGAQRPGREEQITDAGCADDIVGNASISQSQGRGERWDGRDERVTGEASVADENPWSNPLWLPCRDGKYRPVQRAVESEFAEIFNGPSSYFRFVCIACGTEKEEEGVNEGTETMRDMRQTNGRDEGCETQTILQPPVFRQEPRENADRANPWQLQGAISVHSDVLREMRSVGLQEEITSAPQRQESIKQCAEQRDPMRSVSRSGTHGTPSSFPLYRLWKLLRGKEPSETGEDLFCSVCEKTGEHVRKEEMVKEVNNALGLVRLTDNPESEDEKQGAATWIYAPLIQKGKARVGRLRGYGNAIVAYQAQVFIESYLAAQDMLDTAPPSM